MPSCNATPLNSGVASLKGYTMYKLLNVDHILKEKQYFAHTDDKGIQDKELLMDHMNLTVKYFEKYNKKKDFKTIICNLIKKSGFVHEEYELVTDLFANAIYLHDIGKINPTFQREKMGNRQFKSCDSSSEHSIYSAYIYISEVLSNYGKLSKRCFMAMLAFAFAISCHHGRLVHADEFENKLRACYDNEFYPHDLTSILDNSRNIGLTNPKMKTLFPDSVSFFILMRLLFSLMTACDYCATSEYKNQTEFKISIIESIEQFSANYYNSELLKSIKSYRIKDDINQIDSINDLRTQIFLDAEKGLCSNPMARIYYFEAPTGSGKTNTSINIALKLLEKDKNLNNIFYIFPFNTLVEQTANTLQNYFHDDMIIINSITPIQKKNKEYTDYDELWMNRLFNNYPVVVTTHVNFFNSLFGTSRGQVFPLVKLCNSVIIIDEIQSYKNQIWPEIIIFLSKYAEMLNIRIVIMSATLPRLDKVFNTDNVFAELLSNSRKYYEHPIFKNRVKIDTSLMKDEEISLQALADHVLNNNKKKILVEFITKTAARDFYNILRGNEEAVENYDIYELSGDDNSIERKKVISETKSTESMILLATQVIEAGIDIDMDIGYKEVSLPDSEEQFMGRINRSCIKSGCVAYFFNRTKPEVVYKGDCRVNHSINNPEVLKYLKNKDFLSIYSLVLEDLKVHRTKPNSSNINRSISYCSTLEFGNIEEKMQLIKPSIQIYIPHVLKHDGKTLNGYEIWDEYVQICAASYDYSKKKVLMSETRAKMEPFIFNLVDLKMAPIGLHFKEVGGIHFVDNGERFIEDGKFNRKEFNNCFKGRFL